MKGLGAISVDNGSSFTKIYAGEERKLKIPTMLVRVLKVTPRIEERVIWVRRDAVGEWEPYLVGEDARTSLLKGDIDPEVDSKFHGSFDQYVHMCFLLDRLEAYKEKPEILISSLPYSDTLNRELCASIKKQVNFEWRKGTEKTSREVRFPERLIVPQGVGALYDTDMLNNPKYKIIAYADVGSHTTDVPVLVWHRELNEHDYNEQASFSSRTFNVAWAISKIRDGLRQLPGCQNRIFSYHDISNMLIDDNFEFSHGSHSYPDAQVRPIVNGVRRDFTEGFNDLMEKQLGKELWASLDRLGIGGGGQKLIERKDWPCAERSIWCDEWATVRGQFKSCL